MKNLVTTILCSLSLTTIAAAIDLTGLLPIGPLASYTSARDGVTLTCRDQSQIRFSILAPDLIRVRVAF